MDTYTHRLKYEMNLHNYDENYIKLCCDYSKRLETNNLPVIFDKVHFSLLLGIEENYLAKLFMITEHFYKLARIPKRKPGIYREILVPFKNLKEIQRWILHNILYSIDVSSATTGFKPDSSILENAKPHVNKPCIIKLDIKDFFPSIKFDQVYRIFAYHGYTNEVSYLLTKLCTYEGYLPQGSPTSPYISNIICLKLDKRFKELCKTLNADFTRYADDITISGGSFIVKYIDTFKSIIESEGFVVNEDKLKVRYSNERQIVTGIIVNTKLSIPRETKKSLRQQIYYCGKYGVYNHMLRTNLDRANYKDYLYGLAYFIKMVEKDVGQKFIDDLNTIYWGY
ncbi:hypothetical protein BK784_01365 [Bacillus thuringiensis serovar medellin]|uniref:RNA-directed DNA polymerase n=1 Tax=Bacillus thuringiensis subsp. medellin TaxID=79672 RepID=A0A9X6RIY8_BACTV|nr:retron St85 family RNA-directed DNA polymerase [Bacillus thuringiensis]OUC03852.1 hypothetical protein BK784_01365 [Bacillus thuringiensis serovar medellin]